MVRTWKSERRDDETCTKCGSVYEVSVTRYPVTDEGRFDCEVCGTLVRSWRDTYDWNYKLLKQGKKGS
jgi:hypothetical protein